jgi:3'(2'), 5'-bisphosphate nucleotidase
LSACELRPEIAEDLMPTLSALVARASAAILRHSNMTARQKPDGSPVTDADCASEDIILEGLERLLPGTPAISEERLGREAPPALAESFILVDPLDGTREFVAGRDEYTVNVALVSNGRPIAGLVSAPALGWLWRGIEGRGAERLRMQGEHLSAAEPIHTRRWPSEGAVALVSRSHLDPATTALLARLPRTDAQPCGSSLKFCRIAEAAADVYPRLGSTSEWDIAAGHALLIGAGGAVTRPDGSELAYGLTRGNFRVGGFVAWGDPDRAGSL